MWPRNTSPAYDRLRLSDVESTDEETLAASNLEKQELDNHRLDSPRHKKIQAVREVVLLAVGLVCLWIALLAAWRTTLHPVPRAAQYEKQTLTCGNTTDEANARGCSFDFLSHNWVAPACLDPLTDSEYREYISSTNRTLGPFPYYLDKEGKHQIKDEVTFSLLANGPTLADQHVYTTREEHLAHCTFLLRRTHRAALGKVKLNDENAGIWHTKHCLEELRHAERKPLDQLNEGFYVGFAPCTIEIPV